MTDIQSLDTIRLAGMKARGKRPAYFDDPAIDRLLSMVLALASDVAVLRERLDTIERLLDAKGTLARADIEAFRPDREAAYERGLQHRELVARLLRGVQQDMESLAETEPPLDEVSKALRDS
ncbi:MAG: hypothetical protein ACK4Z0_03290 [Sphingomonadaceae bacterium]